MSTPLTYLDKKKFGALVRSLREARGLTQAQLAEMVGLKRTGVTNLESGFAKPSADAFCAIGVALGASLDHLAGIGACSPAERTLPAWLADLLPDLAALDKPGRDAVRALVKGLRKEG